MATIQHAVAGAKPTLFVLAVENLNNRKRSDADRSSLRKIITSVIEGALEKVFRASAKGCACQDTGSCIELVIPSKIAKSELLTKFMPELEQGIEEYNNHCAPSAVCRLRAVFHLAEDAATRKRGDLAARLLGCSFLRLFLTALPRDRSIALLVSDDYYRHVVAPPNPSMSGEFRRARIQTGENGPLTVWAYHYLMQDA